MVPYLLLAYREVEQSSTGFSPFELVYGRTVRGPLDVLKETWEAKEESIVSYVFMIQERLQKMKKLVADNLQDAQQTQKRWYDQKARTLEFEVGEQVLVLLPTESKKLFARPYKIVAKTGKVTYRVEMSGRRKPKRIFHMNMLRKYYSSDFVGFVQQGDTPEGEDIDVWENDCSAEGMTTGKELSVAQCDQV